MSNIFADSFDNYNVVTDYWDYTGAPGGAGGDCSIRLNTGKARTGIGCLQINSAAFGPAKNIPRTQNLLVATNWNCNTGGAVIIFNNTTVDNGYNSSVMELVVNIDGSVSIVWDPQFKNTVYGTSATGLYTFNQYNSLALRCYCHATMGTATAWVNGVKVLDLTGLNTTHQENSTPLFYNAFELMGPGGTPTCYHDDVYALDCGAAPNNNFLGALRLYAMPPTANAAVQWTPLAGTNWSEVSEVPPDGDTSYNSSNTVSQVDQYVYPLAGVPANSSILFLNHLLDMKVDSGSRTVNSDIDGSVAPTGTGLSNGYHIYATNYDTNPVTGVQFVAGDFPLNAGPAVTA